MVDSATGVPETPNTWKAEYAKIGQGIASSSNPNMVYGVWAGGSAKSYKWAGGPEVNGACEHPPLTTHR